MRAVTRRVVVPNERFVDPIRRQVIDWLTARGAPAGAKVTRIDDHARHATVFVTDYADFAAVMTALAADGPDGAERVMALIDGHPDPMTPAFPLHRAGSVPMFHSVVTCGHRPQWTRETRSPHPWRKL